MATTTKTRRANKTQAAAAAKQAVNTARDSNAVYTLGVSVGAGTRKTLESTAQIHATWKRASAEAKKALETAFTMGVLAGLRQCSKGEAETIVKGSRPGTKKPRENSIVRSPEQQRQYDAARKQTAFHVRRDVKGANNKPTAKARNDRALQGEIAGLCGKVFADGLTVLALETLRDQITLMIPQVRRDAKAAETA